MEYLGVFGAVIARSLLVGAGLRSCAARGAFLQDVIYIMRDMGVSENTGP